MLQKDLLIKKMKENNGIITTNMALKYGINKDVLKEMNMKNKIIKIATGLYGFPNEEIDEYLYFSYRIPNGIFSHETAAYLHGLTNRMPLIYVMTVQTGDNVTRIKKENNNVIFKYIKKEYYDIGKTEIIEPYGNKVLSYDKERTVLDIIKNKNNIDSEVFGEILKNYFKSDDINLLKLSKYAIQMNMENKLTPYTEIMLWKVRSK